MQELVQLRNSFATFKIIWNCYDRFGNRFLSKNMSTRVTVLADFKFVATNPAYLPRTATNTTNKKIMGCN